MEEMDALQRLSDYSSFITGEHEDHNGWITKLVEATNCNNKLEFSVETIKKASEVSDYQWSYKYVSRYQGRYGSSDRKVLLSSGRLNFWKPNRSSWTSLSQDRR